MSKEDFRKLVAESETYTEILVFFGLGKSGGGALTLKVRIKEDGLDTTHFTPFNKKLRQAKPLHEVMTVESTYSRTALKRQLLKKQILENKCSLCGLEANWLGKPLLLILDHINGVNNDNRLENLRLLCPNCNSQQSTFAGRNNKNRKSYNCLHCGCKITKGSTLCHKCAGKSIVPRKVKDRPSLEQLLADVNLLKFEATGRKYGVSGNTIRKWIKQYINDSGTTR